MEENDEKVDGVIFMALTPSSALCSAAQNVDIVEIVILFSKTDPLIVSANDNHHQILALG